MKEPAKARLHYTNALFAVSSERVEKKIGNEQRRGVMPKDAKKNMDRYKIRGGDLNEFEFRQNQARVKEPVFGAKKAAKTATAKKSAAKKKTQK